MARDWNLSNSDIENMTGDILQQIAVSGERFDFVVGIARGGLVPANLISQYLAIPLIPLQWSLRDHVFRGDLAPIEEILSQGKRILFVDDMSDSGETLYEINTALEQFDTLFWALNVRAAVLIHNTAEKRFDPHFYSAEINRDTDGSWITFPWEVWWK